MIEQKIAFFDIDGTLTRSDGSISLSVIQALKEVQRRGIKVVLASGRPTFGMLDLAEKIGLANNDGYLISYNGCCIYHVPSQRYILKFNLTKPLLSRLEEAVDHYPLISPIYYANKTVLTTRHNEYVAFEGELNNSGVELILACPESTPKMIWAAEPAELDRIESRIQGDFARECIIERSLPFFLEFTPVGVDKGSAMAELCRRLDYRLANSYAFGDGNNDKSLLKNAGIGVAMANGRDGLKAIADFIAPHNDADGIVVAIEKFLLL